MVNRLAAHATAIVARSAAEETLAPSTFADLFDTLPQDVGLHIIGYAASTSWSLYSSLLLVSWSFNRIVHQYSDLSGLPVLLDTCSKLPTFTGTLRSAPHLGSKFKHLELDPSAAGCGSTFQQVMKIVGYPLRHCTQLESLSCTIEGLRLLCSHFSDPENALPALKWLTLWHSEGTAGGNGVQSIKDDKATAAIARRIEYLHLVWPVSMYESLGAGGDWGDQAMFPSVKRVIALVNEQKMDTEALAMDCERLTKACPNVRDIVLLSTVATVNQRVDLDALNRVNTRIVVTREDKPAQLGRSIFAGSIRDKNFAWGLESIRASG